MSICVIGPGVSVWHPGPVCTSGPRMPTQQLRSARPSHVQELRCCDLHAGPVPLASHQHLNGTQASRSEPAQGKRSASLVSSTAQEAKEDLLAGDLELLSGHLEKAKRCHIHVTSTDTSASAAAPQSRPMAAQPARPAPESPSVSQQRAAPAKAPRIHQPDVSSERCAVHLPLTPTSCVLT